MIRIDHHNQVRYWRDPGIAGLSLLHADFRRHDYAPHSHDAFVIAMTEFGGSEFKSRGRTEAAEPGRLLVFNPAEPHSGNMTHAARWRYRALYFDEGAVSVVGAALGINATPYFTSNVFEDRDLIAGFFALHCSLEDGCDLARERELLIASVGSLVLRHAAEGKRMAPAPKDRPLVHRVIANMEARYTETLTLEMLGDSVGLSPFQLIGLFKRTTGLTPHSYLTQIRLKAAIRAMKAGDSIAQAAVAAGFYDQAALTTHFKRAYGITPLQFARAEAEDAGTGRNFGQ